MFARSLSKKHVAIGGALIAIFICLASRGIDTAYSYWDDESYSIATARSSLGVMLNKWIIPDTAPPLYPLLLKLWILFLGDNEISARALSLTSAALAMILLAAYAARRGPCSFYISIVYIGTLPLFSRYAQEVRNYALVLLLGTIGLICLLLTLRSVSAAKQRSVQNAEQVFHISLILMALTSYFTLIYAWSLLTTRTIIYMSRTQNLKQAMPRIAWITCGLMLIWPILHFTVLGSFHQSAQRFAWNEVTPITGTIHNLCQALLPVAVQGGWPMLTAFTLLLLIFIQHQKASRSINEEVGTLLILMAVFVSAVMVIDSFFAISTDRNFIVIVPCACLLLASASSCIHWQVPNSPLALGLAAILAIQQYNISANNLLFGKITPYQNYKAVSHFLERSNVCLDYACKLSRRIPEQVAATYFPGVSYISERAEVNASNRLYTRHSRGVILITNISDKTLARRHRNVLSNGANHSERCFQPRQSWVGSILVIAPTELGKLLTAHQIEPCPENI